MDSRQQFEAYILKRHAGDIDYWKDKGGLTGMIGSDLYNVVWVQNDYELWQASRESLVVELPDPFWPGYVEEDEPGLCISTHLFTIEQITEVLTGYGIRTK